MASTEKCAWIVLDFSHKAFLSDGECALCSLMNKYHVCGKTLQKMRHWVGKSLHRNDGFHCVYFKES